MEMLKMWGITLLIFFGLFGVALLVSNKMNADDEASEYKTEVKTNSGSRNTEEDIENYKNNRYGEAEEKECSWCSGTGVIGAGESEMQVRRTGMGAGNKCTSCKGTGKIKTWKE